MKKFRNIESTTDSGLVPKIRKQFGDEGVFEYYNSLLKEPLEAIISDYREGKSLKSLAKDNGVTLRQLQFMFSYKEVPMRTQAERMDLINKKLPSIMLERYGVTNIFATDYCKEKIKEHNLKSYGVEYYSQTKEYKDKVSNTMLEKYGETCIFKSQWFKDNLRFFILEKYNDYESYLDKVNSSRNETILKNWGSLEAFYQNKLSKAKKTCLEKYGVDNPFKLKWVVDLNHSEEIINKQKESRIINNHNVKIEDLNLDNFRNYKYVCRLITRKNYKIYKNIINPDNLELSRKAYNLDHIRSIFDCYIDGLTVEQCAHPCNLRVIGAHDNLSKSSKSDITKDELLQMIKEFDNETTEKTKNQSNI